MPSDLPILPSDPAPPPPRTTAEKYGGLYRLGIVGLIVLVGLLAWFAWGVWSLRSVWSEIYVLHDPQQTEARRVEAAYSLSRDPRMTPRQYWDIALRKDLPPLARYLMAESLTAEAVADDPRGYTLAVARSEDWPDWFRLLIARPLAYAAQSGVKLPPEFLQEIPTQSDDPYLRLWTLTTLALLDGGSSEEAQEARTQLDQQAEGSGPVPSMARMLRDAVAEPSRDRRLRHLDRATLFLRTHHPEAEQIWEGWTVDKNGLEKGEITDSPAPDTSSAVGQASA